MKAEVIHLATGFLVGYPPCPYIGDFGRFIPEKYGIEVVLGTHPIPENYYSTHRALETWSTSLWQERIRDLVGDENTHLPYLSWKRCSIGPVRNPPPAATLYWMAPRARPALWHKSFERPMSACSSPSRLRSAFMT